MHLRLPYRCSDAGVVILNDELYIIGGEGKDDVLDSCYRLRSDKRMKWEKMSSMLYNRSGIANSCIAYNGYIWVFGGTNGAECTNGVEKYDPIMNEWNVAT